MYIYNFHAVISLTQGNKEEMLKREEELINREFDSIQQSSTLFNAMHKYL